MMLAQSVASEALLLRRRPAPYVVGGLWLAMIAGFAFGIPYIVYLTVSVSAEEKKSLLDILLPSAVDITSISSYPLFGGAVMLILGVLISGSEYRWKTWKSRFTQGPQRYEVLIAKMTVGALGVVLICTTALALAMAISAVIALVEGAPLSWPAPVALLASLGAAALISVAWLSVGIALGVIFRGTTVALAVGLLWTLAFENVVVGLATIVPALESLRLVLLGSASGSLVGSLGAASLSEGGTPGVVHVMSGPVAAGVLAAYILLSAAISCLLLQRRDVA